MFGRQLDVKRLQILAEVVPKESSIAVIDAFVPPDVPRYMTTLSTAVGRATRLQFISVVGADTFADAFEQMGRERVDAVAINHSPVTAANRQLIAGLVEKHCLPAIADGRSYAEAGLLLTYTTNFVQVYQRAAEYVWRILNGTAPAVLPVEHPSKFEFVVNLKTARSLGIRIPTSVLARADYLIQ